MVALGMASYPISRFARETRFRKLDAPDEQWSAGDAVRSGDPELPHRRMVAVRLGRRRHCGRNCGYPRSFSVRIANLGNVCNWLIP